MLLRLPWRLTALLPLLCLLISNPLPAQVLGGDDTFEVSNNVSGISAVPQDNCDEIGFRVRFNKRPPLNLTYYWTVTDDQGNQTQFVTTSNFLLAPVPAFEVSVLVCQGSGQLCGIYGFATATIPPLSTFTLTPNFKSYVTDGGFTLNISFFGNRCFEEENVFASFLPGSDLGASNIISINTDPTTFGTDASIRINANGAPLGTQNFLFVQVNSDPLLELATAVFKISVVGCCIGSEAPEDQMVEFTPESGPPTSVVLGETEWQLPTDLTTVPDGVQVPTTQLVPNPARTSARITFEGAADAIRVLDANGREVLRRTDGLEGGQADLDLRSLSPGLYFVEVRRKDGERTVKRLSVTR